jgi:hypothetical protein
MNNHGSVFQLLTVDSQLALVSLPADFGQSYFTNGRLPPISSFWRHAPRDSLLEVFFWGGGEGQLNPCGHSPYVTPFLTRRWVCLL